MEILKSKLKRIYREWRLKYDILKDVLTYCKLQFRHNASIRTEDNISKMQYTLLRENHIIEKGMSMKSPKKGFGQNKVSILLEHLMQYYLLYGHQDLFFLSYPLATIKEYIDFTRFNGVSIPEIEKKYNQFVHKVGELDIVTIAGVKQVNVADIQNKAMGDFKSLLYSRHSIRYFRKELPEHGIIDEVLALAQRTPSACNRQGWKTYVYYNEASYSLLKWQGGARGFEEEIPCSILVTANLNAFLGHEVFQAYVDGGLYAMNLINALHYKGLGTIPLSCGFHFDKLNLLHQFDIPENEVPIVIIGCGILMDEFKVAISARLNTEKTNKYK